MQPLSGKIEVPGDKSISHRALILAAMAEGDSVIENLSGGEDVRATWRCLQQLGVVSSSRGGRVTVKGRGWRGLRDPAGMLDAGNAGRTMRLLAAVVAGNPVLAGLTGGDSLRGRPMGRVAAPLRAMGADVTLGKGDCAPMTVRGGALKGIDFKSPVASAQVKSAVLLAGLLASGRTSVTEPALSRDHTERLLPLFGVEPRRTGLTVSVPGGYKLAKVSLTVPGDPSSAAFWVVGALLAPGSELAVAGVGLNPTRIGFIDVLRRMGGRIDLAPEPGQGEPWGRITARFSPLHGVDVEAHEIPALIDEVPILALAATQAEGPSRFRGLAELRHKESDRLAAVVELLTALGGEARAEGDDLLVRGPGPLRGARVLSHGDHRIAMTALIAGLISQGEVIVDDTECVKISYPGFLDHWRRLHG